jgi:hypothetical protein
LIFDLAKDFSHALAAMPQDHPRRRILTLLEEAELSTTRERWNRAV